SNFQDCAGFLLAGGERGPQRKILREGTYAINLAQFLVVTEQRTYFLALGRDEDHVFRAMSQTIHERNGFGPVVIKGASPNGATAQGDGDLVGIVTVHDGPALPQGQIIAPVVGASPLDGRAYHNNFQDPEAFLAGGGMRGRQLQVLVE